MEIRKWNPAETMVSQPSSHKYHIRRLMRSQSLDSLWSVVRGSLTCAVSVDSLALPLLAVKGINKCVRASPSHGNGHLTASCRFVSPKTPLRCALRSPLSELPSLHKFTYFQTFEACHHHAGVLGEAKNWAHLQPAYLIWPKSHMQFRMDICWAEKICVAGENGYARG